MSTSSSPVLDIVLEDGNIDYSTRTTREADPSETPKNALCDHAFSRPHRGESDKLVIRRWVNPIIAFGSVVLLVFVVIGCTLPSFSVEVLGIIGIMVESGQGFESAESSYSLFTIIGMLFDQAAFTGRTADYLGLASLSILMILSVLLVPMVQTCSLLVQWFRPIHQKSRQRLSIGVEILQAWQYMEVFILSIIIASWQLGPVSDFMVNEYCGGLSDTFAQMAFYNIISERDAQCFRVDSRVEVGAYFLAVSSILLALLNSFVLNAALQYFRDKEASQSEKKILAKSENSSEDWDEDELNRVTSEISPTPALFSDKFRWTLYREDLMLYRRGSSLLNPETFESKSTGSEAEPQVPLQDEDSDISFRLIPLGRKDVDLMADTMADKGEECPTSHISTSLLAGGAPPPMLVLSSSSSSSGNGSSDGDSERDNEEERMSEMHFFK